MLKMLTGWKFEIQCLSSVFLCRGLTQATFALLGKMLYLNLLFIAIDSGVLKDSASVFLASLCLTLWLFTGEKAVLWVVFSFDVIVFLILKC